MEPYDLEIGPVQRTFDSLFKSIGRYFQSAQVAPEGAVTESDLSGYTQQQLHKSLNDSLKFYGLFELPFSVRIVSDDTSHIGGIQRSDNITTYDEKMVDGSYRTFNFYSKYGPENMKVSYYCLDMGKGGEETQGILTADDRWYFRITTKDDVVYYLRLEKEIPNW